MLKGGGGRWVLIFFSYNDRNIGRHDFQISGGKKKKKKKKVLKVIILLPRREIKKGKVGRTRKEGD